MCRICWSANEVADVGVTGLLAGKGVVKVSHTTEHSAVFITEAWEGPELVYSDLPFFTRTLVEVHSLSLEPAQLLEKLKYILQGYSQSLAQ